MGKKRWFTTGICSRCGKEVQQKGFVNILEFKRKNTLRFFIKTRINKNITSSAYPDRMVELCVQCSTKLAYFLQGLELQTDFESCAK